MPGVTSGQIAVLSLDPAQLEVAGRVFAVPNRAMLRDLRVGDQITVVWNEIGDTLHVVSITLDKR